MVQHFSWCCNTSATAFNPLPLPVSLSLRVAAGAEMVEAQCQRFEVRSTDGEQVLFSADEEEISIGTEKLRVTGRGHNTCSSAQAHQHCFLLFSFFFYDGFVRVSPAEILTRTLEPISFVLRRHVPEDKKRRAANVFHYSLIYRLTRGAAEHKYKAGGKKKWATGFTVCSSF